METVREPEEIFLKILHIYVIKTNKTVCDKTRQVEKLTQVMRNWE